MRVVPAGGSPGPDEPEGGHDGRSSWRIDEVARRSGVAVDTIRFYQREGLLPAARREGRAALYGWAHLRRLEQIRELQARHFNLAAVKALLADDRLGAIQAFFSPGGGTLSRDELITESGLEPEIIEDVEATGLLADPADSGRTGYDRGDVEVLAAIRQLMDMGMPRDVVLFLARLYTEYFADMQKRVASLFVGEGEVEWEDEDRIAFIDGLGERVGDVFQLTAQVLNYAHQATVRRMTLTTHLPPANGGGASG